MNDDRSNEVETWLRAAKEPERSAEYWDEFPKQVVRQLASQRQHSSEPAQTETRRVATGILWRIGLATACLLLAFFLGATWKHNSEPAFASQQIEQGEKLFREVATLFPNRVRAIAFDQNGVQLTLSDDADVPASTPLLINLCKASECRSFITFSGQQIQINGETFEVLSDAEGEIILVGQRSVWHSADPMQLAGGLRVRATALEGTL